MPMSRYEMRNEYSLADSELYRGADKVHKDDPEALLEGVAMAGLVGVLRQLGDLAEFAAEIFCNLHEEAMATAARGNGLMIRVQQLETEIPSIERAFLSQTDHSSFFYHAGVDWHPNLQLNQNLVTRGDLPRFIMDSYEECRAPPRLFLLDKFDVAGAGACLKRYTDPSFFKVESSEMISVDVQREKKIRKAKIASRGDDISAWFITNLKKCYIENMNISAALKKGPRWRNGETPEVLPTSHSKLHQLFLEERVENGVRNPSLRMKLKRRLNGFPLDLKTGKSYMEKLLKSPSPVHEVLHEVTVNSSLLMSATNDYKESCFEIFEARRSPPSSPDGEENTLNPSMYELDKPPINDKLCEIPKSYPSAATYCISSTLDKVTGEKVVAVDAQSPRENSLTGYLSDDIANEIYVDAPSTMEPEMDGDSEMRAKSDITSSRIKSESLFSDADEEHPHTRSTDSQSTGDSTISDEGNSSSTKQMSSLSSGSPSNSVENPQSENFSAKGFQYDDIPVNEMVDASSYQKTADEYFQVDHQTKPVISNNTCTVTDAIIHHRSEFELLTSSLFSNGSIPALSHCDSEEVRKCMLKAPESDETVSTLNDKEEKAKLVLDPAFPPSLCGFESLPEDDSPGSSSGEQLADKPNGEGCVSMVPDIYHHTTDSSVETSLYSLHEDAFDRKDWNSVDDIVSTLNMLDDLSTNGIPETISSENLISGKLEDEIPKVPENSPSAYPVTEHKEDNIESPVSIENLIDVLCHEDSNGSTDSPSHIPPIMEASLGKKLKETSLANAQIINVENNHKNSSINDQNSSENLQLSHLPNSLDRPTEGLDDAHAGDVIPEEETLKNEILALGTLGPYEVLGSQTIGLTRHVFPNDSEAAESPCCIPEDLEDSTGTEDTVEMDGISLYLSSTRREVTEISHSADLKSVDKLHVLLDKFDSQADKSNTTDAPSVSDNASLKKLIEEHDNCFEDSRVDELENDENCPSERDGESDIVKKVDPTKASASGFQADFSNAVNNDHSKAEISGIFPNSDPALEVDHGLKMEQCGVVDREYELYNQIGLKNHAPDTDAPSLPVDYDTEESISQERVGLGHLNQNLVHPGEISSELSPFLPMNHQQTLDHDDCKQGNDSAPSLSLVDYHSPPSFSELPKPSIHEIHVPRYPKDPLGSVFPPINPFSETNQMNLGDLPPLPPLPPVEWRMGKLQHASSSTEGEMMRHEELSPQLISPLTVPSDNISSPQPPTSTHHVASSPDGINSSLEEMNHTPIDPAPEIASEEENIDHSCSSLEANTLHETTDLPPMIQNEQQKIVIPISESVSTPPAEEDRVENGNQRVKLPWPHKPLIDDISVLNKSKLRKVTERVRPEIQKVDERDSLLEQIRTKSFNLKPAMASRPSIRGPDTNLQVAAILEKANAIRQALAGSDEDDDSDSWSDS